MERKSDEVDTFYFADILESAFDIRSHGIGVMSRALRLFKNGVDLDDKSVLVGMGTNYLVVPYHLLRKI